MSFPIVALFIYPYYWALQSYILRIEEILNIVGVAISIIEAAFLILAFLKISARVAIFFNESTYGSYPSGTLSSSNILLTFLYKLPIYKKRVYTIEEVVIWPVT